MDSKIDITDFIPAVTLDIPEFCVNIPFFDVPQMAELQLIPAPLLAESFYPEQSTAEKLEAFISTERRPWQSQLHASFIDSSIKNQTFFGEAVHHKLENTFMQKAILLLCMQNTLNSTWYGYPMELCKNIIAVLEKLENGSHENERALVLR